MSPSRKEKENPPFPQQKKFALVSIKDMLVHFIGYEEFLQP
jgi:hypothetical protein